MRVRARAALRPYYNYRLIDISEGEEVSGGLALHLLETGSDVEPADDAAADWQPAAAEGADSEQAPDDGGAGGDGQEPSGGKQVTELDIDGNADDVVAWVGDDPERAEDAIEQETAKDKPRSTLLKKLQKIADADSGE
ncbi:hypothetical protein ACGFWI_01280 [Streptomyces sp. NPDC048434]|uniref:hypothetical protein n=1 Tax=Streptomyces sp. NPDC048434 TaxID=3365549 RepID=UPI0037149D0A